MLVSVVTVCLVLAGAAAAAQPIAISSPAFNDGGDIPLKFTCDGSDTSPALKIANIPATAKSLVLIMEDPDAPGGLFTHWLVWNVDPKTSSVAENASGGGTIGRNDFGKSGYGGPCPPSGSHRYVFRVFALDRQLGLAGGATRKQIDQAIKGHVVGEGELTGRYGRKN
jgi:Raf kinase inhibitor-like YbhB/YbcL family protein